MTSPQFEVRERNGRHGVWDRYGCRWMELDGGTGEMDEHDAEVLARDLAAEVGRLTSLPPQELILAAEQMIRRQHGVLSPGYPFWGKLADDLNDAATIPDKTNNRESDWRRFNRAQAMATAIIELFPDL